MSGGTMNSRGAMAPLGRAVRAFVAPVDRSKGIIAAFDPSVQGQFDLDTPPAPYLDLGWVENFERKSATKYTALRNGPQGAITTQFRCEADAMVEFDLPAWGKVQLAVACGTQQMNVLATTQSSWPAGSGGTAIAAVRVQDGSNASGLVLSANDAQQFNAGDMVAVDVDYTGTTGYVGTGVPAAYLSTALDVGTHVDYVRRVTFNVGRIVNKVNTELELGQSLIGGVKIGMGVQKVAAFVDREGSSYFQEWSGLFVVPADTGGRVCFYYPRLQVAESASETRHNLMGPIFGSMLHAKLRALPTVDANDGETVLCYRSYFPAMPAAVV